MTAPTMDTHRQQGQLGEPDETGVQEIELSEADKQALEADGEYVPVPVNGVEVRVKPQIDWRMSDLRALNAGDFDAFAKSVIHPADLDVFMDLDLTMGEFRDFSEEAARRAGDSLGKSSPRSRSSRLTRAR